MIIGYHFLENKPVHAGPCETMDEDPTFSFDSLQQPLYKSVQPARQLLSSWTLAKYLSTKPPSHVVTLDSSSSLATALKTLATHNILSAPVFETINNQYLGFLDLADILAFILSTVAVREACEETRMNRLAAAGALLEQTPIGNVHPGTDGALLYKANMQSSFYEVVQRGLLRPYDDPAVIHRIAVFDYDEDTMSDDDDDDMESETVKGIRITHVVSQTDIIRFLQKHMSSLGPLTSLTLDDLGLAYKPVICVPADMPTINALATMQVNRVLAVGVISHAHHGALVANLSVSDLRGLMTSQLGLLGLPILKFLAAKSLAAGAMKMSPRSSPPSSPVPPRGSPSGSLTSIMGGTSVGALGCSPSWGPSGGSLLTGCFPRNVWGLKGAEGTDFHSAVTCMPSCTFGELLNLMVSHRVHRVYVVDNNHRPVGLVTATDVLRVITVEGYDEEGEEGGMDEDGGGTTDRDYLYEED